MFSRCVSKHPTSGARCWLAPGHEGAHLILAPGKAPSPASIARVAAARTDLPMRSPARAFLTTLAAMEPVGKGYLLDPSQGLPSYGAPIASEA